MIVPAGDKLHWEREEPPALLSRAEIVKLLDPWLNGREVLDAELLAGGLMNRNFLLRLTGRPAECVLRIYDRDPAACAREMAVLAMIGRDVPVPRVLYADEKGEHGPHLAVLSVIDGVSLFALRSMADPDEVDEACYDAGRVLARLGAFPGPPTPRETTLGLLRRFGVTGAFQRRVSPVLFDSLQRIAEAWQPRLDAVGKHSCLVHGDFNSRNVFVATDGDRWRVSGVLDWEFALDASAYVDIGNFLRYHRADRPRHEPHFSRGLRDGGVSLEDDWLTIARLMDLPALCELLSRPRLAEQIVPELLQLLDATIRAADSRRES